MDWEAGLLELAMSVASAIILFNSLIAQDAPVADNEGLAFVANGVWDVDYALQEKIPGPFGEGEFTFVIELRLDDRYPVGPTRETSPPEQLRNWSDADVAPYSGDEWWYEGNFLLDGHNNNDFEQGTFSLQFYGGGRIRWHFGDGHVAGPGKHWTVGAYPASSAPSLLDGQWRRVAVVRRWKGATEADLELWVDGDMVARQTSPVRTNMRRYWDTWEGYYENQAGWLWGTEKFAATREVESYDDFKGSVRRVEYWSRALSREELRDEEHDSGPEGLVGLYDFTKRGDGHICNELTGKECVQIFQVDYGWRPGIHLRNVTEWFMLGAYSFSIALALSVPGKERGARAPVRFIFAGFLTALACVKLFGLDGLTSQTLEEAAKMGGWYYGRKPLQYGFLAGCALVLGLSLGWLRIRFRMRGPEFMLLLVIAGLVCLTLARVASPHLIGSILGRSLGPISVAWSIEALLVAASIVCLIVSRRRLGVAHGS